ncbi:MAG: holo-ACP synthase [Planctomycetota bacterium]
MAVLSVGVDLVEIDRLEEVMERRGERFTSKVFTPAERAYCGERPRPVIHFAGRFAVKEAVLKALRTGWVKGISWQDVEVETGSNGEPVATLTGGARERADAMGLQGLHISIAHTEHYAVATAVAEG